MAESVSGGSAPVAKKAWSDLYAGFLSGFICGVLYQPFDVIKVNMIVLPNSFHFRERSPWHNLKDICGHIHQTGGPLGFFKGTTVSVLRASLSSGIYFMILRELDAMTNKERHSKSGNFLNSAFARCAVGLLLNPLGILRTRCQLIDDREYSRFFNGMAKVFKEEKFRAFTKGSLSMFLEEFPFGGIFNLTYEYINEKGQFRERNSKAGIFGSALVSGILAATVTHPAELVRTKIQAQKVDWHRTVKNSVILSILVDAYHKYGISGLFKGLQPRLIKKTLVTSSTFFIYELLIQKQNKLN